MKHTLIAITLAIASSTVSAITVNSLQIANALAGSVTASDAGWGPISTIPEGGYTSGFTGALTALESGIFTATYLGQAAAYGNFYQSNNRMNGITNGGFVGSTNSINVTAGQTVNFSFGEDNNGDGVADNGLFANGDANEQYRGILFFRNSYNLEDANGQLFDFLVGYNDSATVNSDYDDYVIGVRSDVEISQVPLPAALPLMASALGLFAFGARRRMH